MTMTYRKCVNIASAVGTSLMILCIIYGWHKGIFSSQENLERFVSGFGILSGLVFVLIQIIQVIIPIIPGGISCLAGVVLFGAWAGFVYNYVGICIGSICVFLIAKRYGRPVMEKMFSQKLIAKYEHFTDTNHRFTKLFAIAIFLPVAPDDFLCYLAGTTNMSLRTFTTILLLGKPFAIAAYSVGLNFIFQWMLLCFR